MRGPVAVPVPDPQSERGPGRGPRPGPGSGPAAMAVGRQQLPLLYAPGNVACATGGSCPI